MEDCFGSVSWPARGSADMVFPLATTFVNCARSAAGTEHSVGMNVPNRTESPWKYSEFVY